MLDKIYTSKTNKQLQSALNLYSAVFIVSIVMPIILATMSYLLNGKIQYTNIIIFSIIIIWSSINIKFLKKKLNNKNGKEV
jgi:hypothetical protein